MRDPDIDYSEDVEVTPRPLRVEVYVNSKRVKFINRSKYKVDLSFSQRCKV